MQLAEDSVSEMALYHSPSLVTDGLILAVDAANVKSYSGSGTSSSDLSGQMTNGSLVNGVSFSSSNGGIFTFDGVNDRITHSENLTALNSFSGSSSFTMSICIRIDAMPSFGIGNTTGILQKNSYNNSFGMNLSWSGGTTGELRTEARWYHGLRNTAGDSNSAGYGGVNTYSVAGFSLVVGQWYKSDIVHYFSGTTHTLLRYTNGVLDGDYGGTSSTYPINITNTSALTLNNGVLGGNGQYAAISVSNYQIYNRALTASEIRQNFNALRGRFGI